MFKKKFIYSIIIAMVACCVIGSNLAQAVVDEPSIKTAKHGTGSGYVPNQIIVKFKNLLAESLEQQLAEGKGPDKLKLSKSLDDLSYVYNVQNIKPVVKNYKANRAKIEALKKKDKASLTKNEKHLLNRLQRAPKNVEVPDLGRIYKIELELGQSAKQAVAEYNANPDVEYAELNYIYSACSTEPNDPNYPIQWPLSNIGQSYPASSGTNSGTPDCDIDANEAWDLYTGSSDVIVAVIDTGVDYTHRDLQNNMWTGTDGSYGYDYVNDDNDPMDDHGHGTHCAGIIAANTDNGLDIAGISWNAKIMAVKFLDKAGYGNTSNAILCLAYATDNGADIASNSWGGGAYLQSLADAINYAYSQGVITVAAAGNNNANNPNYYPANYNHVIAVAATDSNDDKASFSNYGEWVNIAAPGKNILSLRANGTSMGTVQNEYTTVASGTSMACPHVSGVCSLLLSVNPYLSPDDVNHILMDPCSVDPITDGICRCDGRVNAYKAIVAAITSKGYINFDKEYYNGDCNVVVSLVDLDLKGQGTYDVNITSNGNDLETITLSETDSNSCIFTGTISTECGDPNQQNGILEVGDGNTITVTYEDADDGSGNPASPNDTATIDTVDPNIISDISVIVIGPGVTVTFDTDEFTIGRVHYGTDSNNLNNCTVSGGTNHSMNLYVEPWSNYYFAVTATDIAGNEVADDNDGSYYRFSTDGPNNINIPDDYNTIQEAINYSWDGGTVTVAAGTYYENIDFKGKAIVLTSTDPNDWDVVDSTIISGSGSYLGTIYFINFEDVNSVLTGFKILNSADYKAGVFCGDYVSATISKCILEKLNHGIYIVDAFPTITNNIIRKNRNAGIVTPPWQSPTIKNNRKRSGRFG